jgi:hypothetical protein
MLVFAWDGAMGSEHQEIWLEYLDGDYLADFDEYVQRHNRITYLLSMRHLKTLSFNMGIPKNTETNLSQCHFIHKKNHTYCPAIKA